MAWSRDFVNCKGCGTTVLPHRARGLCAKCYNVFTEKRQKVHLTHRNYRVEACITKETLEEGYRTGLSLGDLARQFGCTRQYIHLLMARYGIPRRTRSEARALAIKEGKIVSSFHAGNDHERRVVHQKRVVNEKFFRSWSPAMAYVLGIIYTDGCLVKCGRSATYSRLTIGQKEPELLEKVLALMGSNAKIVFTPARGIAGALHTIQINNRDISRDLQTLGLTPNKSLTLQFPEIPSEFVRHFIRGCWDGDGSVYLGSEEPSRPGASYVSGSRGFIVDLVKHLVALGLPDRTLHAQKRGRTPNYSFRFNGYDCAALFHVLYDDVDASMYLARKHDRFKAIADYYEREGRLSRPAIRRRPPMRSQKLRSQQIKAALAALKKSLQSNTVASP